MSRRGGRRPIRFLVHGLATIVALAVTTTILALFFGLLAVRFVGLSTYVVQGAPTESMVPIGSLVLVAPISSSAVLTEDPIAGGDDSAAPVIGTSWVAIPTLGYAVTYADAYSSPIVIGIVVWFLSVIAARALAPHFSSAETTACIT